MNITFFIGNGFDLNLGLQTRYSDFYPYFLKNASSENLILKWLKETKSEESRLWADLEIALGKLTEKINIDELEQFYGSRIELNNLLCDYLSLQQKKFNISKHANDVAAEYYRSITSMTSGLSPYDNQIVINSMFDHRGEGYSYNFIDYNYTDCLDKIISTTGSKNFNTMIKGNAVTSSTKQILHIHGTIDNGMIMGVNDDSQISNEKLKTDPLFVSVFTKNGMNNDLGDLRTETANNIIESSRIIAIYGMSIGETDTLWWETLYKWLAKYPNALLIIYKHSQDVSMLRRDPQVIRRYKDQIKSRFLLRAKKVIDNNSSNIENRILISLNNDIFKFKEFIASGEE